MIFYHELNTVNLFNGNSKREMFSPPLHKSIHHYIVSCILLPAFSIVFFSIEL